MSDEPRSVIEASGRVAEKAVVGLSTSPGLLLIVILNITMVGMAGYALLRISELSAEGRTQIMSVLEACIAGGSDRHHFGDRPAD